MENDHLSPLKSRIIPNLNTLYCYRELRQNANNAEDFADFKVSYADFESEKVKTVTVTEIKASVFDQLNEIIPDRETLLRMEQITHRMNDWDGETKIKLLEMLKKLIELT